MEINKIYNENCLEGMKRIADGSIDLVVTDPPYKTTARGSYGNVGGMLKKDIVNTGKMFAYNNIEPDRFIPEIYRILKEGTHFYLMTNHKNLIKMITTAENAGFYFIKSLIWDKSNKIMGQAYMSQFEYILFFRKGKFKKINNCGTSDIISIKNVKHKDSNGKNYHDTEKPVKLMELLVNNSSNENEIVLDPFMGIGTTAIACMNTQRNFIGFEMDKGYYDIACKRIEESNSCDDWEGDNDDDE